MAEERWLRAISCAVESGDFLSNRGVYRGGILLRWHGTSSGEGQRPRGRKRAPHPQDTIYKTDTQPQMDFHRLIQAAIEAAGLTERDGRKFIALLLLFGCIHSDIHPKLHDPHPLSATFLFHRRSALSPQQIQKINKTIPKR